MSQGLFYQCPCYLSGPWTTLKALRFHQKILICVPKLNEGLAGLEQREVINGIIFWGVNYPFKEWLWYRLTNSFTWLTSFKVASPTLTSYFWKTYIVFAKCLCALKWAEGNAHTLSLSLSLSHTHTTRFSCESHTCKAPAAMTCKILLIDDEQEG